MVVGSAVATLLLGAECNLITSVLEVHGVARVEALEGALFVPDDDALYHVLVGGARNLGRGHHEVADLVEFGCVEGLL